MKIFNLNFLKLTFFVLIILLGFLPTVQGQSFTFFSNPNGFEASGAGYTGTPIIYNGKLYMSYENNSGNFMLTEFDGNSLEFISNPADHSNPNRGYIGAPIIYNNSLYLKYNGNDNLKRLVSFNGTDLTFIPVPVDYNIGYDFASKPYIFNNKLYTGFRNSIGGNSNTDFIEFDGTNFTSYNADARDMANNLFEFNGKLYGRFGPTSPSIGLGEFDGSNISIPSNNSGFNVYQGEPFIYNGKAYLRFEDNDKTTVLMEFDGTNFSPISSPSGFSGTGKGYSGLPIAYNGKYYLTYRNTSNERHLVAFDGTNLTVISNPAGFNFDGYNHIVYNDKLYLSMVDQDGNYMLGEYDGTSISLIPNPDGYEYDDYVNIVYDGKLYLNYLNTELRRYDLGVYDGTNLTIIPSPAGYDQKSGFLGNPIIYNGNLYIQYQKNDGNLVLAKVDYQPIPCDITNLTAGDPYDCDPNENTYSRDLHLSYEGTGLTGTIEVLVEGQGGFVSYPILNTSPQTITLTGLPSNGDEIDVFVKFSDESGCSINKPNLFTHPQNCGDNAGGDCDITTLTTGDQRCDYDNGTYEQDLVITYTDAPTTGSILLKANNQSGWETFPIIGSPQTLTLSGRTPGEGNVDIFVKFSDDNGCTFSASNLFTAPDACSTPPSGDGTILFVVKDANNMHSGDAAVKAQLESTGYTVEVKSENAAQSSDATGKELVLISNTVSSGAVNTKFTNVMVPVVCYESLLFDELGMTGTNNGSDYGQDSNEQTIDIDNAGHSMAAGLNGEPQVYSSDGTIVWGKPNSNAIKVASTQGWYGGQWAIFGYETGSSMVSGTAPARRASLFFKASQVSKLNTHGWALFDAVICWAIGCQTARFAPKVNTIPQIKAYPNPFQNELTIEWDAPAQNVHLSLINLMRQQVFSQQLGLQNRLQVSVGHLPKGIYILQVIGQEFKRSVKIIKK